MSYVKKINGYFVKDEEARQEIANIKTNLTGAMHYIGASTTNLANVKVTGPWSIGGRTYNVEYFYLAEEDSSINVLYIRNKDLDSDSGMYFGFSRIFDNSSFPSAVYINGHVTSYEYVFPSSLNDLYILRGSELVQIGSEYPNITEFRDAHALGENEVVPSYGSVATYKPESKEECEYVYGPTGWEEFGSTGSLKALAFKDTASVSASGSCTPQGTNEASAVTFQTPGVLPYMEYDSATETLTFKQGSFPSGGVAAAQVFKGSNTSVSVTGTAS